MPAVPWKSGASAPRKAPKPARASAPEGGWLTLFTITTEAAPPVAIFDRWEFKRTRAAADSFVSKSEIDLDRVSHFWISRLAIWNLQVAIPKMGIRPDSPSLFS